MSKRPSRTQQRQPRHLGEWIESLVPPENPVLDRLHAALLEQLPEAEHSLITGVSHRRGTVHVAVQSSCLLHEMRAFRYEQILKCLQEATDTVTVQQVRFTHDLRAR